MHTTASSLVAIAQYDTTVTTLHAVGQRTYAYKVTKLLYGNQQIFNIEAVNDYPPIRFDILFES